MGPDDLEHLYRDVLVLAAEQSRRRHDPATDWNGFPDALWDGVARGFRIVPGE